MNTPVLLKPKEIKPMKENLSQSEVQQLLHILREELQLVSFHKEILKQDASELWDDCDKRDKFTASTFAAFSQIHTAYKQHKQEEKKLVSLITKLKSLR